MGRNLLRLTLGMIIRRGHYGYFLIYWLYGMILDYRLAGKSLNQTVFNNKEGAFPVQCISYPYIKALEQYLKFERNDVFVDVGCAWGRLLGYVRVHTKLDRLIGIELNPEVASFAQHIFRYDQRIEIISGNVLAVFPQDGTVFYLFNPFDKTIFIQFIKKIEEVIYHPIKLLYLHPTCRDILDRGRINWTIIEETEIKPRYLGKLTLCIYEYNPC